MDLPEAMGRSAGDPYTRKVSRVHAHARTPKFREVLIFNSVLSFILTLPEPPRVVLIASRPNFTRFGTEDKLQDVIKFLIDHLIVTCETIYELYYLCRGRTTYNGLTWSIRQSKCMPIYLNRFKILQNYYDRVYA